MSKEVNARITKRRVDGVTACFFSYNATHTDGSPRCEWSLLSEVGEPYVPYFKPLMRGRTFKTVDIDRRPWVVTVETTLKHNKKP
jgi:hypothetical protein